MKDFFKNFILKKSLRLKTKDRSWSFKELNLYVQNLEFELKSYGVRAGDILAIKESNQIFHIALFLVAENLGLLIAPFYEYSTESEFSQQLNKLKPEWLLTFADGKLRVKKLSHSFESRSQSGYIFQTSGTTGQSGFIFKSFENLFNNAAITVREQSIDETSNIGCILTFSHVGGLCMQTTGGIIAGSCLSLLDRYQLKIFSEKLNEFSHSIIVPSYFHLLKNDKTFDQITYKHQPLIVTGSTYVTESVFSGLKNKGFQVHSVYGLTEIGPYACVAKQFLTPPPGSLSYLGQSLPEYEMRLHPQSKEIEIKGLCLGEMFLPEENRFVSLTDENGFLKTGDQGDFIDDVFYYRGRIKNIILVGGFKINPFEIEQKILEKNYVQNCAVVGKPHSVLGEVPIAYVIGDKTRRYELSQYLREQLSPHKVPRQIEFVDTLPETSIGKNRTAKIEKETQHEIR